jgi:hypothetical protein
MKPSARLFIAVFFPALLFACGSNCRETVRMGDFEFSQGNYVRAEKLFAEAWAADSLKCPDAGEKLENTRRFMRR